MLHRDITEGVHRIGEHFLNWYLIEDGGQLTVIDAGLPASWRSLLQALNAIGHTPDDIEALVLTHAHFDHIGFAERARAELGIPVWVHENDAPLTKRPDRKSTRLNSSHANISYAVFCLKKNTQIQNYY